MTVKEIAQLCGISVRTLHYYDEISLLSPAETTQAGYRIYGDSQIKRLRQILFFRELDLPLQEIKKILDSPSFDEREALCRQRELLLQKHSRLERLIGLVDATLKGEDGEMSAFDETGIKAQIKKFSEEAEERWGDTAVWKEYSERSAGKEPQWNTHVESINRIFGELSGYLGASPSDRRVQELIGQWQAYINEHFYTCTKDILRQLGDLYLEDPRFKDYYDSHYQEGMAQFVHDAIVVYCQ